MYAMSRDPPGPRPPLVWSRLAASPRPRPRLDHDRIVRSAMRLADQEGLRALSMRKVADEVNAGAMSLYRYVASKEELFDLMLDAAYGEIAVPEKGSGDWRRDLAALARQSRDVLKRHPWAAQLVTSRPTLGPSYLRWFEFSLEAVTSTGVDLKDAMRVIGTTNAYVSGVVAYELGDGEARRRHGLSEPQMRALVAPYLDAVVASGRFPNLKRFLRHGSGAVSDADFEFGLAAVLDGLAAALRKRRRPARSEPPRRRPKVR
jgi:AcrR family transcriptional regulator